MMLSEPKTKTCPECNADTNIIYDPETGENICQNCGLVIDNTQTIVATPEKYNYDVEQYLTRTRTGPPQTFVVHDKGLSTSMGRIDVDRYGKKLPVATQQTMWRLRKHQIRNRVHNSHERNLIKALQIIKLITEKLDAPKTVNEHAAVIYRKILAKNLVQGRNIKDVAAATVYHACRAAGILRDLKQVAVASGVTKKTLFQCYRLILCNLDNYSSMPLNTPAMYIARAGEILKISGELQGQAIRLLQCVKGKVGKDPRCLAAAALYIVLTVYKTGVKQVDLARVFGITEVTVRNRYKELYAQLLCQVGLVGKPVLRANKGYQDLGNEKIKAYLSRKEASSN